MTVKLPCAKVAYDTERQAKQALNRIRLEYPSTRKRRAKHPLRSYPCAHCGRFHLTSHPTTRPKAP